MTTPTERTRNLIQAGAFLKELRADELLPEHIRIEADRLLRHYPTVNEFKLLASSCSRLSAEFDPDWLRSNRLGAHV